MHRVGPGAARFSDQAPCGGECDARQAVREEGEQSTDLKSRAVQRRYGARVDASSST